MCRCLKVSTSGFHAWCTRPTSARMNDNQRLLVRIRQHHAASDGVMGMPRMHEALLYEGERASPNRVARLMAKDGLFGIPQRCAWRRKRSGVRPTHVRNHLERDFSALEPNTKWVTDITYIRTGRLALSVYRTRPLQPQDRRLVDVGYPGPSPGTQSGADGVLATTGSCTGGVAFGSRHAIYQWRISTVPGRSQHHQQHE